jgi:hypothetical protein
MIIHDILYLRSYRFYNKNYAKLINKNYFIYIGKLIMHTLYHNIEKDNVWEFYYMNIIIQIW